MQAGCIAQSGAISSFYYDLSLRIDSYQNNISLFHEIW